MGSFIQISRSATLCIVNGVMKPRVDDNIILHEDINIFIHILKILCDFFHFLEII